MGAGQAILETTGHQYPPFFRGIFDRHIQIAREQLGETTFEVFTAEGRAMTMEQAIIYALENSEQELYRSDYQKTKYFSP